MADDQRDFHPGTRFGGFESERARLGLVAADGCNLQVAERMERAEMLLLQRRTFGRFGRRVLERQVIAVVNRLGVEA